mgnify:CR=1 FL=1
MQAVFDTNIFISAFVIPGGNAEEAYLHAMHGAFELFTSVAILTETATTLQTKSQWAGERVQQLLRSIGQTATILKTRPHLHILEEAGQSDSLSVPGGDTSAAAHLTLT